MGSVVSYVSGARARAHITHICPSLLKVMFVKAWSSAEEMMARCERDSFIFFTFPQNRHQRDTVIIIYIVKLANAWIK